MVSSIVSTTPKYLQRSIIILFHLLVICVPFIFTWVNEELFEFPKMLLTYVLTAGILCLWLSRMVLEQRVIFRRTAFDIPIGLFVISQLASTIFSIHPYTSFFGYYTRFHGGLLSTLTYVSLYYAFVSNLEKHHIPRFLFSTLIAAIGVSLYAIPEHFGHSPSCYLITGGKIFDVSCWIQDVKNRVFGTFGQPNWLAAYTITLLPVSLSLAITSIWPESERQLITHQLRKQVVAGICLLTVWLLYVVLLFTQSKSGMLGLLGGLGIWTGLITLITWFNPPSNQGFSRKTRLKGAGLILGITFLGLVGLTTSIGEPFAPNFSNFLTRYFPVAATVTVPGDAVAAASDTGPVVNRLDIGGTDSGEIRKIVWTGAWNVFKRYPVLGSGVETFAYSYYQDRPVTHNLVSEWDFLYNKAHNEFLNYLATTGVVGFTTYTLLLVWFGVAVTLWITNPKNELRMADRYLLAGLVAGIGSLTISNLLGFSTVMVTILMYLFLAIAALLRLPTQKHTRPISEPSNLQYLSLGGIAITLLYVWSMIGTWWAADHTYTKGKQYLQSGYTVEALELLESATQQAPSEALFYDELANSYAMVAASLAQQNDATTAAQIADAAIAASDHTLTLNSRHLNFYKSRARVFINLSAVDPSYFAPAKEALLAAIQLSPTDAKLRYNLALVEAALGQTAEAEQTLKTVVAMKQNYEAAYLELGRIYAAQGKLTEALDQYRYIISTINATNPVVLSEYEQLTREATSSGRSNR